MNFRFLHLPRKIPVPFAVIIIQKVTKYFNYLKREKAIQRIRRQLSLPLHLIRIPVEIVSSVSTKLFGRGIPRKVVLVRVIVFSILFFSASSFGELHVTEKSIFYDVSPKSKQTMLSAINAASPVRNQQGETFHANANYRINWRFWWQSRGGECRFTRVKTDLVLTYKYPRLNSNNKAVNSVWNTWMPRLVVHEKGHGKIARRYANRIDKMLTSMGPERDCKTLEKKANASGNRLLKKLDDENRLYDKNTNHGETQQAWLYQHL